jgi:hypothetical protein
MKQEEENIKIAELDRWFKEKWVDISRKDKSGKYAPCGRKDTDSGKYPKCRPSKRVNRETPVTTRGLTEKEEKSAIRKKRKAEREKKTESAGGKSRKPKRAPVIKRSDSRMTELVSLYKMAINQIASFDFDGTIRLEGDVLNHDVVSKIMEEKSKGKVYLVTARTDTKDNVDFVMKFLRDNEIFSLCDGFYFVGDFKYKKLQELGVVKHYDNDDREIMLAKEIGIDTIKV